jgi:hypothetical protein
MESGDQLRNYAAQLAGQESENQGAVFNIFFVEAGFGLRLEYCQFNIRVVIFEMERKRNNRIMNG